MTLQKKNDMYDYSDFLNFVDVNNKLFCTFVNLEEIDNFIKEISHRYVIMYNKLFVLYIKDTGEYVVTYNTDQINLSSIPDNTILVHRKKETNTLYTINALNELIKKLNGGAVDIHYKINWQHYKNTILLTQHNELKQLKTKIHNIVEL
jgi:hypothetical protein